MTNRTWVATEMAEHTPLTDLIGGQPNPRIHQSTSIDRAPDTKPFIMFRQTSDTDFVRGDDSDWVRSVGFMIFCHDIAGDYMQIDTMIEALQQLFKDTRDPAANVVRCRWIDTSDDLRDDDMGTIMKYGRIQVFYRV